MTVFLTIRIPKDRVLTNRRRERLETNGWLMLPPLSRAEDITYTFTKEAV